MLPLQNKDTPIRIVIACQRRNSCKAIRALLSTCRDIEIIAETSTGQGAISIVEQFHPDVVLLDMNISIVSGIRATKRIKRRCPDTHVLLLTINGKSQLDARAAGADGILDFSASPEEIVAAIRNAADARALGTGRESHAR